MEKKNKTRNAFYNILIIILVCVIAFSSFKLWKILKAYHDGTKAYKKIEKMVIKEDENHEKNIDWETLLDKYPDVVAWIYSPDTPINYPIAQSDDNNKYLRHLLTGEYNVKGTIFADYRCKPFLQTFNTIIYGHYMNDGTIFGGLHKYADKEGFYEEHKEMYLLTPGKNYKLRVVSGAVIKATSKFYMVTPGNDTERSEYISQLLKANTVNTDPVSAEELRNIIMLSTCTAASDDNRFVLWLQPIPLSTNEKVPL